MRHEFCLPAVIAAGVATDGTAYTVYGDGPPLVLIHGVGMNQSVWAPQIEAFARDRCVIVYDMLGHGRSALPPATVSLSDYALQLGALLDELGVRCADVVGHSMGALIALEFALSCPARCRSVTALNAVFCRNAAQRKAVQDRAAMLSAVGSASAVDAALERWFGNPVPPEQEPSYRLAKELLNNINPVGYARTYTIFANADTTHAQTLNTLQIPALFITGELDPNSTPNMSSAMAKIAPIGRAEVLLNERHMMSLTAPASVNAAVLRFLEEAEKYGRPERTDNASR
jgi:pimeloyl-ACP methyl ester carboxylesterase